MVAAAPHLHCTPFAERWPPPSGEVEDGGRSHQRCATAHL